MEKENNPEHALWDAFSASGKVGVYLLYSAVKSAEDKREEDEPRG